PRAQQRVAAQLATQNAASAVAGGGPVPRVEVRRVIRDRHAPTSTPPTPTAVPSPAFAGTGGAGGQTAPPPAPSDLWLRDLTDLQAPVAIACLIHDLTRWLSAASAQGAAVKALARALAHPSFLALLREVEEGRGD